MLLRQLKIVVLSTIFFFGSRLAGQTTFDKTPSCTELFASGIIDNPLFSQDEFYHLSSHLEQLIHEKLSYDYKTQDQLRNGVIQIFVKKFLGKMHSSARVYVSSLIDVWTKQTATIYPQVSPSKKKLTEEKILRRDRLIKEASEIISLYPDKLLSNPIFNPDSPDTPKKEQVDVKTWIDYLKQFKQGPTKDLILKLYDSQVKGIIEDYYRDWIYTRSFGATRQRDDLVDKVYGVIKDLVKHMNAILLLDEQISTFSQNELLLKGNLRAAMEDNFFILNNQDFNPSENTLFKIDKTHITYFSGISSIALHPRASIITHENAPLMAFAHGATTYKSTPASWLDVMDKLDSIYKINTISLDHWGSLEDKGIAIKGITSPIEYALFSLKYFNILKSQSVSVPLISVGRSFGSTTEFATSFYSHIFGLKEIADLVVLSSFSNPYTIDDQIKVAQYYTHTNISLKDIPGSYDRVKKYGQQFREDLDFIRDYHPELLENFGDSLLFVQGEIDEDAYVDDSQNDLRKRAKVVIQDLLNFKNTFAPRAHVYFIEAPVKDYPKFARYMLDHSGYIVEFEGRHLLYSPRSNTKLTEEQLQQLISSLPSDIIEELSTSSKSITDTVLDILPNLEDQLLELLALKYAMLDYLIDYSKFTSQEKKSSLSKMRFNLTGSWEELSYFKYFITKIISSRTMSDEVPKKVSQVFNSVDVGTRYQKDYLGRFSKVLSFVKSEAQQSLNIR